VNMKKVYLGLLAGLMMVGAAMFTAPLQATITAGDITGGKKAPHVNIAIFHKLHGHDDFVYPKEIKGADIIQDTAGKAQFIAINHTSGLQDGDILSISNDVLRENAGNFADFGVDCQISVHLENSQVTLGGMCQILIMDQDHREIDHKGIVKPYTMHPGADWELIYYDAEDGIGIYADENMGME